MSPTRRICFKPAKNVGECDAGKRGRCGRFLLSTAKHTCTSVAQPVGSEQSGFCSAPPDAIMGLVQQVRFVSGHVFADC
jgi:hypothetical protein